MQRAACALPWALELDTGDKWCAEGTRQEKKVLEGLCMLGIGLGTYAHITITSSASGQALEVFFKANDADKLGEGGGYH